ncbi:hypothetical protein HGRIS_001317 [Hohenbuehelia grisea]|uniref:Uncharacterized protein n=1 Tax=Hohenbuehelia grisea TaxID=104357 RepID=A0ABR3JP48_9AGAR
MLLSLRSDDNMLHAHALGCYVSVYHAATGQRVRGAKLASAAQAMKWLEHNGIAVLILKLQDGLTYLSFRRDVPFIYTPAALCYCLTDEWYATVLWQDLFVCIDFSGQEAVCIGRGGMKSLHQALIKSYQPVARFLEEKDIACRSVERCRHELCIRLLGDGDISDIDG